MRRSYGRSKVGSAATKVVPNIRTKNISLSACISLKGVFFFEIMDRPYNAEHFGQFIQQLLDSFKEHQITNCTLIMDNVPFHHNDSVKRMVQGAGFNLKFLLPYSPFLNPIEEVFAKWKGLVRAANCNGEDDLYSKIHSASHLITQSDCLSYFRHMQSFISRCIQKLVIE